MQTTARRGRGLVVAIALLLGAAGSGSAWGQEGELAAVRREVEGLRELSFLAPVDVRTIDRDELRDRIVAELRESGIAEELQRSARAQAALGLMPEGVRVLPLLVAGVQAGIVGLYVPETDELLLIGSDDGGLSAIEEWTAAHESVHALQDQRLGLDGLFARRLAADDDAALAVGALIEGDPSVVDQEYLAAHPELTLGLFGATVGLIGGALELEGAPPVLAHAGTFPYVDGAAFVRELRGAGGWARVDAAYADPPVSTEQVLHPEKFLERDEPTAVDLPEAGALGEGWEVVHAETLGELQTTVLLAGQTEPASFAPLPEGARRAAAGWDGDRYALWSDGEREVVVWRSVWDSAGEAEEFAAALRAALAERSGGAWRRQDAGRERLQASGRVALLEVEGEEVRYAASSEGAVAERALEGLTAGG